MTDDAVEFDEMKKELMRYGLVGVRGYLESKNDAPSNIMMLVAVQWRFKGGDSKVAVVSGSVGCPACIADVAGQTLIDILADGILALRAAGHKGDHAAEHG